MNPAQKFALHLIRRYQSGGGGRERFRVECNFHPSCSEYAYQAIIQFGAIKGSWLAMRRICRCNQPDLVHSISDPVPHVCEETS